MARLSNSQAAVWAYAITEQFNERIENNTKVSRKRTYEVRTNSRAKDLHYLSVKA
jgi:hypothetical protein